MVHILLIEADKAIMSITKSFLEARGGYIVTCARTGAEAMAAARCAYDVIVIDFDLPDADGEALCRSLRKWRRCPILFLAEMNDITGWIRILEAGGVISSRSHLIIVYYLLKYRRI